MKKYLIHQNVYFSPNHAKFEHIMGKCLSRLSEGRATKAMHIKITKEIIKHWLKKKYAVLNKLDKPVPPDLMSLIPQGKRIR